MANKNQELIEKAILLRKQGKRLCEIAQEVGKAKTTVLYWLKDIELTEEENTVYQNNLNIITEKKKGVINQNAINKKLKSATARKIIYDNAFENAYQILEDDILRNFITIYIAEGDKRNAHIVGLVNTDVDILLLTFNSLKKLSIKAPKILIRYYKDQNPEDLKKFWKNHFGTDLKYKLQPKDNQTNLKGSNYANKYGLVSLYISDGTLKCQMNAYMDYLKSSWLNS